MYQCTVMDKRGKVLHRCLSTWTLESTIELLTREYPGECIVITWSD